MTHSEIKKKYDIGRATLYQWRDKGLVKPAIKIKNGRTILEYKESEIKRVVNMINLLRGKK